MYALRCAERKYFYQRGRNRTVHGMRRTTPARSRQTRSRYGLATHDDTTRDSLRNQRRPHSHISVRVRVRVALLRSRAAAAWPPQKCSKQVDQPTLRPSLQCVYSRSSMTEAGDDPAAACMAWIAWTKRASPSTPPALSLSSASERAHVDTRGSGVAVGGILAGGFEAWLAL